MIIKALLGLSIGIIIGIIIVLILGRINASIIRLDVKAKHIGERALILLRGVKK